MANEIPIRDMQATSAGVGFAMDLTSMTNPVSPGQPRRTIDGVLAISMEMTVNNGSHTSSMEVFGPINDDFLIVIMPFGSMSNTQESQITVSLTLAVIDGDSGLSLTPTGIPSSLTCQTGIFTFGSYAP